MCPIVEKRLAAVCPLIFTFLFDTLATILRWQKVFNEDLRDAYS